MRFVELIRVSGAGQAARDTPADQRAALDRLRLARPGTLVERIEEGAKGLSGALPLDKRPDITRLAELAKARAFDEVRVRHIDRLTRHEDPRVYFAIYGIVMDAGAVIVDGGGHVIDPTTEMGVLDFAFQASAAAREKKRIRERLLDGRRRLAAQGFIQGRAPFARRWNKLTRSWSTDDGEAKVYRRIFREVLAGRSLQEIARRLSSESVPKPQGRPPWSAGNVAHLVRSPGAYGEIRSYGHAMKCPPVVDRTTWDRANSMVRENGRDGRPPTDPALALLRGIAVCGTCGSAIWVVRTLSRRRAYWYYVCRWRRIAPNPECRAFYRVEKTDAKAREALLAGLSLDVAPEAEMIRAHEAEDAIPGLTKRMRELAAQEDHLLGVLERAPDKVKIQGWIDKVWAEREGVKRELEAARLVVERPAPSVDRATRAAMLRRARVASASELRSLVLSALRPGDAVLLPGGEVQLRTGALGSPSTGERP